MKKIIVSIAFCLLAMSSTLAQKTNVSLAIGGTYYNTDTEGASDIGLMLALVVNHIYMDMSSNFAAGEGKYLEFETDETYDANKVHVTTFNFGYEITEQFISFIPHAGAARLYDIRQDPVGFDTFFYDNKRWVFNLGVNIAVRLVPEASFYIGGGLHENFRAGLMFHF